ncbi:Type 1 glutamine amidotransferase-like domain-containing protein [Aquipuribacter hungaricus]|uniref:Type 1 glutamine amidotransferase-like domain-containing protein n=1 Tax=Aquipuribacter hungaricus TaxID=545624 RepID=A0ABV7WF44_9MICO
MTSSDSTGPSVTPDDGGGARRPGGQVLLQGGGEMREGTRAMDAAFLAEAPPGPVVVLLGAATPGSDHARASARALRYHEALVGDRGLVVAPHPEDDLAGCVGLVAGAAVVVLPGGSPVRLLDGLRADGGRLGAALVARHAAGASLSGSSAGAMVLCARAAQPDRSGPSGLVVHDGLGLVPGLAVVHDDGSGDGRWRDPADPDGPRWGLPEQGGVLVADGLVRAVGRGPARLLRRGSSTVLGGDPVPLDDLLAG